MEEVNLQKKSDNLIMVSVKSLEGELLDANKNYIEVEFRVDNIDTETAQEPELNCVSNKMELGKHYTKYFIPGGKKDKPNTKDTFYTIVKWSYSSNIRTIDNLSTMLGIENQTNEKITFYKFDKTKLIKDGPIGEEKTYYIINDKQYEVQAIRWLDDKENTEPIYIDILDNALPRTIYFILKKGFDIESVAYEEIYKPTKNTDILDQIVYQYGQQVKVGVVQAVIPSQTFKNNGVLQMRTMYLRDTNNDALVDTLQRVWTKWEDTQYTLID